jgi:type II secretory ATPase GspE/PulE/Tfp pilus assembly ATPase PilB-like protein
MTEAPELKPTLPPHEALSRDYLEANRVLPLALEGGRLRVAACGEPEPHVLDDLFGLYGAEVELVPVEEEALRDAVRRWFAASESVVELVRDLRDEVGPESSEEDVAPADVRELAKQPPVVRFVSLLIREAFEARASDIHLDASREGLKIRYRIDGVLSDVAAPPKSLQSGVLSRLKLLAELDIAERRLPQDGRVRVRLEERELDLRVATVPTHFGESMTLRLLDRGGRPVGLEDLGMAPEVFQRFRALARRPHGILLATGPTGSGKTTTLYAALGLRDRTAEKIITVEDPIEYELPGITQVPVNEKTDMTFARALRSILRHDPDVMMVGEMRDEETADIAVRSAMTGHLVFSTLHTNDAVGAVPRLLDLNVAPYLVGATVEAVLAQRLVRKTCTECRKRYRPDPQAVALLAERPVGKIQLERGKGCAACRGTGYRGRTGIFELLVFSDEIKAAVSRSADRARLRELTAAQGMRTLKQDGWAKVEAGITTVEEVLRVVQG